MKGQCPTRVQRGRCTQTRVHTHTHTHVYNEQTLRLKLKWPVRLFTKVSKKLCHRKNAAHLHLATVFSPQFPVPLAQSPLLPLAFPFLF